MHKKYAGVTVKLFWNYTMSNNQKKCHKTQLIIPITLQVDDLLSFLVLLHFSFVSLGSQLQSAGNFLEMKFSKMRHFFTWNRRTFGNRQMTDNIFIIDQVKP